MWNPISQKIITSCKNKEHPYIWISAIPALLYFMFMFQFYNIEYFAPDHALYAGQAGFKATAGFSSLYCFLSLFIESYPKQTTIMCLVLLTLALFNFGYFSLKMLNGDRSKIILAFLFIYSSGIWFYFYGKLFSEFPFGVASYSLCLLATIKIIKDVYNPKLWYLLALLGGFTLSWKAYNIFCIVGLVLLLILHNESRSKLIKLVKDWKGSLLSFVSFCLGFVIGNFYILVEPVETLTGLKAFRSSFDFIDFMLLKTRIIWDHINDLPFNLSVMNLFVWVALILLVPIVTKKSKYLLATIFMSICLGLFIQFFSPGLSWHAFPYALFLLTCFVFLLSEIDLLGRKVKLLMIFMIVIQSITCYVCYIPTQVDWVNKTNLAIKQLEDQHYKIYQNLESLMDELAPKTVRIDVAVRRWSPVAYAALNRKKEKAFARNGYNWLDPLAKSNPIVWFDLHEKKNYAHNDYDYLLWVVPESIMTGGGT